MKTILTHCPPLSKVLINTYRSEIDLYIDRNTLTSQEGITQGLPLTMAMFAIATAPLIEKIANDEIKWTWYTDDAASGGNLMTIKWWDDLQSLGPNYGYCPNP